MTNLSARQFRLLEQLVRMKAFSLDEAKKFNQTSFGSMIHRNYLKYVPKSETFFVSPEGFKALAMFREAEILRKINNGAMSCYFERDYNLIRSNIIQIKKPLKKRVA